MKYRPDFPERFGSAQDALGFSADFFRWYNNEHHHTGLGLLTPADVHFGRAEQRHGDRALVLDAAHRAHPERFGSAVLSRRPCRRRRGPTNPSRSTGA